MVPIASSYDAFLVACFSAHPLINALREELAGPVIGIMEGALYAARMLGGRLGIVTTGARSKIMHEDAIRYYGLEGYSVGCESTNLGVLELGEFCLHFLIRLAEIGLTSTNRDGP